MFTNRPDESRVAGLPFMGLSIIDIYIKKRLLEL